ncbi:MAG TPA: hypothetical protein VHU83_08785 [Bryobacteraceae bacterium]|jgi:hypothetical protein|nr:hypothetical protein [Bryobacteraceae bacterium]
MPDRSPLDPAEKNGGAGLPARKPASSSASELDSDAPGQSTGPRSPNGKATSSLNRLTHGCRSEQILIPGEDPAEFEFVMDGWFSVYDPQDPIAQNLVEELGKAHWFLKRNEKWLHQVQTRLPYDAWLWTDENHKLLANTMRYKTTAERAFFRWYKALEAHYNREFHRQELAERARARAAALNFQWLNKREQRAAENLKIKQYAQIFGDDDRCATVLVPSNEQIKATVAARPEPPEIITRLLYFTNGVPAAYDWLNPTPVQCGFETVGLQTMLYSDWLKQIDAEQLAGTGHLIPCSTTALLPAK